MKEFNASKSPLLIVIIFAAFVFCVCTPSAKTYYEQGLEHYKLNELDEALALLEKQFKLTPN